EMTTSGLRYTGILPFKNSVVDLGEGRLYADGTAHYVQQTDPTVWKQKNLTGFDAQNNPVWGPWVTAATSPIFQTSDPNGTANAPHSVWAATDTGIVGDLENSAETGYHFGGVNATTGQWAFKTGMQLSPNYFGAYPSDATVPYSAFGGEGRVW